MFINEAEAKTILELFGFYESSLPDEGRQLVVRLLEAYPNLKEEYEYLLR